MCISLPESVKSFSEKYFAHLGIRKRRLLPVFMAAMAFCPGKRTYTALGKTVMSDELFKTNVSKFFKGRFFRSRDIYKTLFAAVIGEYIEMCGDEGDWVMLLDGTSTKRGGFTKIGNALKFKKKNPALKGTSTKAHTFVMGVLILPNGMRLPLARRTYYTKQYCRHTGRKYMTQNDLAAEMIAEIRSYLPKAVRFVFVADSYFDCAKVKEACDRHNAVFITNADSGRNLIREDGSTQKLHSRGKHKRREEFRTFNLIKGAEQYTRAHSRYAHPELKKKTKHVYRATGETLNVSAMGTVRVVFSWKNKSGRRNAGGSFRVLLCSDVSWSDRKIVEFYALRWQVEIFFRELKSDLGLADFVGQDFEAFERFVDVCLMTFVFLECERMRLVRITKSRKEKGKLATIRTRGMISLLREKENQEIKNIIRKMNAA